MSEHSPVAPILRSMPWPMAEAMAGLVTGALSMFLIARLIGADEFGRGSIALGLILIMQVGVNSLVHDALVRLPDLEPDDLDVGFTAAMALALAFAIVAAGAAWWVGTLYADARLTRLILGFIPLLPLAAISETLIALRRRALDFRSVARVQITGRVLGGVLGVTAAVCHLGGWSLAIQNVATAGFVASVMLAYAPRRPRPRLSWRRLSPMLAFCGPIIGSQVTGQGTSRLLLLAIGHWHGLAVAGYWSAATRISENLFGGLMQAAYNVGLAHFSARQSSRETLLAGLRDAQAVTALLALPMLVGLAAASEPLTLLLLGKAWSPVAGLIIGPLIATFLQIRRMFPTTSLRAIGRSGVSLVASIVESVTLIALFLLFGRQSPASFSVLYPLGVAIGSLPVFGLLVEELKTPAFEQLALLAREVASALAGFFAGREVLSSLHGLPGVVQLVGCGASAALVTASLLLIGDRLLVLRLVRPARGRRVGG